MKGLLVQLCQHDGRFGDVLLGPQRWMHAQWDTLLSNVDTSCGGLSCLAFLLVVGLPLFVLTLFSYGLAILGMFFKAFQSEPPPAEASKGHFEVRPPTAAELPFIREVLTNLSGKSALELGPMSKKMEADGARFGTLYPLSYIDYVLSTPDLRAMLIKVKGESLKWSGFLMFSGYCQRMAEKMREAHVERPIDPLLPGFAAKHSLDPAALQRFVASGDWKSFMNAIVPNS